MMDKEFLDRILDQALEEASTIYVKNDELENNIIEDENVEFSDIHKEKMKKLFKEVRREDNRRKAVRLTKKVAIIVLCTLLLTCGLITTVEAWREQVIKFIMQNNDNNYMSINVGDVYSENNIDSGDANINKFEVDDIKFLYLPEGFEFVKKYTDNMVTYYSFENNDNYIRFKKEKLDVEFEKYADIENTINEKINFVDKEVFKIVKDNGRISYVWYDDTNFYDVVSDTDEEKILKFIKNLKILKNF